MNEANNNINRNDNNETDEDGTRNNRLGEWSIEELEEELRRRKRRKVDDETHKQQPQPQRQECPESNSDATGGILWRTLSASTKNPQLHLSQTSPTSSSRTTRSRNISPKPGGIIQGHDEAYETLAILFMRVQAYYRARRSAIVTSITEINRTFDHFAKDAAIYILRGHPSLVADVFHERSAISFFLQARVDDVPMMAEICDMVQKYCTPSSSLEAAKAAAAAAGTNAPLKPLCNPIADACVYGVANAAVLRVLIEHFPHLLLEKVNERGHIPFEVLLDRLRGDYEGENDDDHSGDVLPPIPREVIETLETMLEYCPNMLDYCNTSCLLEALEGSFGGGMRQFLFQQFAEKSSIDRLDASVEIMTGQDVLAINRMLPKLKIFRCLPQAIDTETYCSVFDSLYTLKDPGFVELGLPILPEFLTTSGSDDPELPLMVGHDYVDISFQAAVKRCRHLKKLDLQVVVDPRNPIRPQEPCILLTKQVIQENPGIVALELSSFNMVNARPWNDLMVLAFTRMKSLVLDFIQIVGEWPLAMNIPANSCLETFELKDTDLSRDWCRTFLPRLAEMPRLTDVTLAHRCHPVGSLRRNPHDDTRVDVTDIAVMLIRRTRIRSFCLGCGCQVNMDALARALAQNTSLKDLLLANCHTNDGVPSQVLADVLKNDNTTLTRVETRHNLKASVTGHKIMYFTTLNRYGRAQLQEGTHISLSYFLDLLCNVVNDSALASAESDSSSSPPSSPSCTMRHNILFGLLLENPKIWSSGTSNEPTNPT